MKRMSLAGAALLAAALFGSAANAQGTIKVGAVLPLSGQFADLANQIDNGIKV